MTIVSYTISFLCQTHSTQNILDFVLASQAVVINDKSFGQRTNCQELMQSSFFYIYFFFQLQILELGFRISVLNNIPNGSSWMPLTVPYIFFWQKQNDIYNKLFASACILQSQHVRLVFLLDRRVILGQLIGG